MNRIRILIGMAFLSLCVVVSGAPGKPKDAAMDKAKALFAQEKWAEAEKAFLPLTEREDQSGAEALLHVGICRVNLKRYDEAVATLDGLLADVDDTLLRRRGGFHLMRARALMKDKDGLLAAFQQALDDGFVNYGAVKGEAAFQPWWKDAGFAKLLDRIRPCAGPEYHQFDYWIGDWDVFDPAGKKVGENRITVLEDGCGLQEKWTGAGGNTGTSYNAYDPADKKWHQTWISAGGNLLLSGRLFKGEMVLESEPDGTTVNRITWTPRKDGSVRQHWEVTNDAGANWETAFDGIYKRRKP